MYTLCSANKCQYWGGVRVYIQWELPRVFGAPIRRGEYSESQVSCRLSHRRGDAYGTLLTELELLKDADGG